MPFGRANPDLAARKVVAWCWCYCCNRRLEVFESRIRAREEQAFACCGRTWGLDQPQPPALHDGLVQRLEDLQERVAEALALLERWPGRRPRGLKLLVERLRARVTKRA